MPEDRPSPELRCGVNGHGKIGGHTYYYIDCVLAEFGHWHKPFLVWRSSQRLSRLRAFHDPVKAELGSNYQKIFADAPFATRVHAPGTTRRLDLWCGRLAYCVNARLIRPALVATILQMLRDTGDACESHGVQRKTKKAITIDSDDEHVDDDFPSNVSGTSLCVRGWIDTTAAIRCEESWRRFSEPVFPTGTPMASERLGTPTAPTSLELASETLPIADEESSRQESPLEFDSDSLQHEYCDTPLDHDTCLIDDGVVLLASGCEAGSGSKDDSKEGGEGTTAVDLYRQWARGEDDSKEAGEGIEATNLYRQSPRGEDGSEDVGKGTAAIDLYRQWTTDCKEDIIDVDDDEDDIHDVGDYSPETQLRIRSL